MQVRINVIDAFNLKTLVVSKKSKQISFVVGKVNETENNSFSFLLSLRITSEESRIIIISLELSVMV